MITFTQFLLEARRNPEQNKKISTLNQLLKIKEQYGTTNIFVTFTQIPKLGANPGSSYDTPLGIYSYPLDYVLEKQVAGVPFAGKNPYIIVFKTNSQNVWNLTTDDVPTNIKQSIIQVMNKLGYNTVKLEKQSISKKFWYEMYSLIPTEKQGIITRKIFKLAGITGIIDPGLGIVHSNEPTQAVFFDTKNIKQLALIDNKHDLEVSSSKVLKAMKTKDLQTIINTIINSAVTKRYPLLEKRLFDSQDGNLCLMYCIHYQIRIEQFEPFMLKSKDISELLLYTKYCRKQEWPELEPLIVSDRSINNILDYAINIKTSRSKDIENKLLNSEDIRSCIKYASKKMPGERWPELEELILDNVYVYVSEINYIIHNMKSTRWPEFEQKILNLKKYTIAYQYAIDVIKGRWPEAEPLIQQDEDYWNQYKFIFKF